MRTTIKTILTTYFLLILLNYNLFSQIEISNVSEISKIKNGTTYIALGDPNSPKAKDFIDAIKSSWTISKVEFIKYSDIENYLSLGNSYLTIGCTQRTAQFVSGPGNQQRGTSFTNTHFYIELWTVNERYFERKRKRDIDEKDKNQVARIELFTDFETLSQPERIFQLDYDGSGHIRNWSPGILKNYLQTLMSYLNKGDNRKLYAGILNSKEMKNLRNEVLYVPDYVFIKFNRFTGDESKRHDVKDIFSDYKLKYEVVTTEELSQKILTSNLPIYYMLYVRSSTDKFVSVVNSQTGEIIYSTYSPLSYSLKSDDLEDLQKKAR